MSASCAAHLASSFDNWPTSVTPTRCFGTRTDVEVFDASPGARRRPAGARSSRWMVVGTVIEQSTAPALNLVDAILGSSPLMTPPTACTPGGVYLCGLGLQAARPGPSGAL